MTKRIASSSRRQASSRPLATWRRKDDEWHLIGAGRIYATICRDYDHWVCFALDQGGNHYDVGPAIDLAHAKKCLSERFAPLSVPQKLHAIVEEAPL